ncbi:tyrosine-type recombinase/integrase [Glutamicibacter protophormiae]|uniref:tyrosine-type recombinase/integrase n=1 Tax=Glutamicibacter protophormiae TaxID=37930 RepID=UPI003317CC5F
MSQESSYPDLSLLLESWLLALRAERKSPATLKSYGNGIRAFLAWCEKKPVPPVLSKDNYHAFSADLLDEGREASTVVSRQLALRRFSAWLTEEQEIPEDDLAKVKTAKIDSKVIEPLTPDEIKAFLKACQGNDFMARRDEAIFRLMVETGIRAGECVSITTEDLNLMEGTAIVRRGKGGKGRVVPFGSQTARALDRYRRARAQHSMADLPNFWLGARRKGFTYDALHKALEKRATEAGIERFHPHLLRHTAAHRWLSAGGSETGLMAVAGWSQSDMLQRYTKARASDRAAQEARSLNLGDL